MKQAAQIKFQNILRAPRSHCILSALLLYAGTCVAATPIIANAGSDLIEPERAFQLAGRYKDPKTIELHYKIAEGYYLYRTKFKFAVEPATDVKLGNTQISKGKMKQDPTFGWVETYRDAVRIVLPIFTSGKNVTSMGMRPMRLKVTSQGCADAGVCYPPLHQYLTFQPGSLAVVLPDGIQKLGGSEPPLTSTPATTQPSIAETLRNPKQP